MSPSTALRTCLLPLLVVVSLAAGCASGGKLGGDGGTGGICPSNPGQCGGKCCGSVCVNTEGDFQNCGECGKACDNGLACSGGVCGCPVADKNGNLTASPCGQGQTCCGVKSGCKNLTNDSQNCGSCGRTCGMGGTCTSGQCTCGGKTCATNQVCCNGTCAATCTSPPDMAMPSGGGMCTCSAPCALGCFGGCCIEEVFLGSCMPDPSCPPV